MPSGNKALSEPMLIAPDDVIWLHSVPIIQIYFTDNETIIQYQWNNAEWFRQNVASGQDVFLEYTEYGVDIGQILELIQI